MNSGNLRFSSNADDKSMKLDLLNITENRNQDLFTEIKLDRNT